MSNPNPPAPKGSEKDRVLIFDTTLRDGEQCPGASMTFEEKLEVAELLDNMGVDIIEAGFPIASQGDFDSVAEIAKRSKNATIAGLARAAFNDIDRCAEAVKHARRPRIHTFLSTSPVHMKYKLQKEPEQVLEMVVAQVTRARNHVEDVEWSSEDGTRTEIDFLCRCVEAAIKAGALSYLLKDVGPDDLVRSIRAARRGEATLHPSVAARLMQELAGGRSSPLDLLTEREREVLGCIARGMSNAAIADHLIIGERTVKTHVSNILSKLHLQDRTQAALLALRERLVPLDETDGSRGGAGGA